MILETAKWLNDNHGVVTVLIFGVTLFLGWVSGIFATLRRRPKLQLKLIPGPTFCSTFETGEKRNGFAVHRTALSLYLRISNVGSAPTSIENVSVGFHWSLRPFSIQWVKFRVFWYWLDHPVVTMTDFQYDFGSSIKIFPALFQGSATLGTTTNTYLEVGRATNGVIYFEQPESWGGCFPRRYPGKRTRVKIAVTDAFGNNYKKVFWLPLVPIDEARKYNPSFGGTYATLQGQTGSQSNEVNGSK